MPNSSLYKKNGMSTCNQRIVDKSVRVTAGAFLQTQIYNSPAVARTSRTVQRVQGNRQRESVHGDTPIQLFASWRDFRSDGVRGTKKALITYFKYLSESVDEAMGNASKLDRPQKNVLKSYLYKLDAIMTAIECLPDEMVTCPTSGPGKWSVLCAGTDNVQKWLQGLDEQCQLTCKKTWSEQKSYILSLFEEVQPIIELYYELSIQPPTPTPAVSPSGESENEIILYRRMWKGEADTVMSKGVQAAMGPNDNYKKYFTTDITHTESFQNANSVDPDNEVIICFTLDWTGYWDFVARYGSPNQKRGALNDKGTAIMNQERIVKGAGANFRVDEQVKNVITKKEHHNIGIGQGNAAEFDALIKNKVKR